MAGGLLNLLANGNNNIMLTGNPTKTFFKAVYSKYTNFGLQKFRIDYDGLRDLRLTEPSTFTFKIPRYAELLMDTYIVLTLPNIWSPIYHPNDENLNRWAPYEFCWIRDLGTHLIKEILITCGSQTIQKYSGEYLAAMIERDFTNEKKELINNMTGNVIELYDPGNTNTRLNTYPSAMYIDKSNDGVTPNVAGSEPSIRGRNLYIPINTWFTLDNRCAFPLISLQYNELVITVTMRPIQELFQVRDITDPGNNFPYIKPDFNQQYFQMYRYLQSPPSINLDPDNYPIKTNMWNADIHLMSTYCFLSKEETKIFAGEEQIYLIKDVFQYKFDNVAGSSRLKLTSSGMIANWMFYLQRNDVNLRNEWSNYTNWAYRTIPSDIIPTPNMIKSVNYTGVGPSINTDGSSSGIFHTGTFNADNQKEILQTMGILLNGDYRENNLISGIYNYIEKYTRTPSCAKEGLYCYNFCLNTNPTEYQPSGAINMSKFKDIQLEITTYIPTIDPTNSFFQVICDGSGTLIGVNKQNWRLYEYNYNLTVFEERYNILSFIGGNCGMLLQR